MADIYRSSSSPDSLSMSFSPFPDRDLSPFPLSPPRPSQLPTHRSPPRNRERQLPDPRFDPDVFEDDDQVFSPSHIDLDKLDMDISFGFDMSSGPILRRGSEEDARDDPGRGRGGPNGAGASRAGGSRSNTKPSDYAPDGPSFHGWAGPEELISDDGLNGRFKNLLDQELKRTETILKTTGSAEVTADSSRGRGYQENRDFSDFPPAGGNYNHTRSSTPIGDSIPYPSLDAQLQSRYATRGAATPTFILNAVDDARSYGNGQDDHRSFISISGSEDHDLEPTERPMNRKAFSRSPDRPFSPSYLDRSSPPRRRAHSLTLPPHDRASPPADRAPAPLSINTSSRPPPGPPSATASASTAMAAASVRPEPPSTARSGSLGNLSDRSLRSAGETSTSVRVSMADLLTEAPEEWIPKSGKQPPEVDRHLSLVGVPEDTNTRGDLNFRSPSPLFAVPLIAVVNALRTLQEKVGQLEGEKAAARDKIADLEDELSRARQLLFHDQNRRSAASVAATAVADAQTSAMWPAPDEAEKNKEAEGNLRAKERRDKTEGQGEENADRGPSTTGMSMADESRLRRAAEDRKRLSNEVVKSRLKMETELENADRGASTAGMSTAEESRSRRAAEDRKKLSNEEVLARLKMETELQTLKTRSKLLERQLDYSTQRVRNIQNERDDAKKDLEVSQRKIAELRAKIAKKGPAPAPAPAPTPAPAQSADGPPSSASYVGSSATSQSQSSRSRSASPDDSFLMRDEIANLKREIEAERAGRVGRGRTSEKQIPRAKPPAAAQVKRDRASKRSAILSKQKQSAPPTTQPPLQTWKKVDGARPRAPRPKLNAPPAHTAARSRSRSRARSESCPVDAAHHVQASLPALRDAGRDDTGGADAGRDMPFIIGKSTSKSYSVTANLQRVFALLKSHNPSLCSVCSERRRRAKSPRRARSPWRGAAPRSRSRSRRRAAPAAGPLDPPTGPLDPSADHAHHHSAMAAGGVEGLGRVLHVLEDEFRGLKSTYRALVKRYESEAEATDRRRDEEGSSGSSSSSGAAQRLRVIGDELREVIRVMEIKGDQISILRDILGTASTHAPPPAPPPPASPASHTPHHPSPSDPDSRSRSPGRALASLSLLRSSLKLAPVPPFPFRYRSRAYHLHPHHPPLLARSHSSLDIILPLLHVISPHDPGLKERRVGAPLHEVHLPEKLLLVMFELADHDCGGGAERGGQSTGEYLSLSERNADVDVGRRPSGTKSVREVVRKNPARYRGIRLGSYHVTAGAYK
ncbi:hypothetical protein BDK51DRAFT_45665 [Blyttiomyces helicus]|uniref:Uncharacterized protein n=1 Tax=Blyttiomyces helicus TaxID=388810 RepID=A0A4P9WJ08_9FUNG|nr:hypothetical protein BDK51DRAFT_45665 [Blyttiomyces helicus]|eukprot:RKO91448.1 hypothetical protein BDK51DRAFT_45665 [Blyttiomyces helicus]